MPDVYFRPTGRRYLSQESLRGIEEKRIVSASFDSSMNIILWAAAVGVGVSFLVFVKRKMRDRRERSRSLSLLGTVSQQWLVGHRAEN